MQQGWYREHAAPAHLWLVREADAAYADSIALKYANEHGVMIHVAVYGPSDEDLPSYLRALIT